MASIRTQLSVMDILMEDGGAILDGGDSDADPEMPPALVSVLGTKRPRDDGGAGLSADAQGFADKEERSASSSADGADESERRGAFRGFTVKRSQHIHAGDGDGRKNAAGRAAKRTSDASTARPGLPERETDDGTEGMEEEEEGQDGDSTCSAPEESEEHDDDDDSELAIPGERCFSAPLRYWPHPVPVHIGSTCVSASAQQRRRRAAAAARSPSSSSSSSSRSSTSTSFPGDFLLSASAGPVADASAEKPQGSASNKAKGGASGSSSSSSSSSNSNGASAHGEANAKSKSVARSAGTTIERARGWHRERYQDFLRAYYGLSAAQAARAGALMRTTNADAASDRPPYRATAALYRHTVVSVEGDAIFHELLRQSETMRKRELHVPPLALHAALNKAGGGVGGGGARDERSDRVAGADGSQRAGGDSSCCTTATASSVAVADSDADVDEDKWAALLKQRLEAGGGEGDGRTACADALALLRRARTSKTYAQLAPPRPPGVYSGTSHRSVATSTSGPVGGSATLAWSARGGIPNARCVVLHCNPPASSTARGGDTDEDGAPAPARLMAIIASTRIEKGERFYVCLDSYYRCLDEAEWYRQRHGDPFGGEEGRAGGSAGNSARRNASHVLRHTKQYPLWPRELELYHTVGDRHRSPVAEACFPLSLLDLVPAPQLGERELGIVAAAPVPYATCFVYAGPTLSTGKQWEVTQRAAALGVEATEAVIEAYQRRRRERRERRRKGKSERCGDGRGAASGSDEDGDGGDAEVELGRYGFALDDTYAFGLDDSTLCYGQGLVRYINHRYNTSRFGNVELSVLTVVLPPDADRGHIGEPRDGAGRRDAGAAVVAGPSMSLVQQAAGKPRQPSKAAMRLATIPFFITTADVAAGEPLLAWTYGEDYDARLERVAVAATFLVPYRAARALNEYNLQRLLRSPARRRVLEAAGGADGGAGVAAAPLGGWQRYGGDYRRAIHVGDVVWCPPRPSVARARERELAPLNHLAGAGRDRGGSRDGGGAEGEYRGVARAADAPHRHLYRVVRLSPEEGKFLLLQPLCREHWPAEDLSLLLSALQLHDYRSPFAESEGDSDHEVSGGDDEAASETSVAASAVSAVSQRRVLAGRLASPASQRRPADTRRSHSRNRAALRSLSRSVGAAAPGPSAAWAVFPLPQRLPVAALADALALHVVADASDVALLLPDTDYMTFDAATVATDGRQEGAAARGGGSSGNGDRKPRNAPKQQRADVPPAVPPRKSQPTHMIVHLGDLARATQLVRREAVSDDECRGPLCSGTLWPLMEPDFARRLSQTARRKAH